MPEVLIQIPKVTIGQKFLIKAEVKENPTRFDIDFMEAKNNETYLHFKVDFKARQVLRNSALEKDAGWGDKEVDGGFPFTAPMTFELTILIEAPQFSIRLNNNPFCTFRHRSSPLKINALRIRGDIIVHTVDAENTVRRLSAQPMPQSSGGSAGETSLQPEPPMALHRASDLATASKLSDTSKLSTGSKSAVKREDSKTTDTSKKHVPPKPYVERSTEHIFTEKDNEAKLSSSAIKRTSITQRTSVTQQASVEKQAASSRELPKQSVSDTRKKSNIPVDTDSSEELLVARNASSDKRCCRLV